MGGLNNMLPDFGNYFLLLEKVFGFLGTGIYLVFAIIIVKQVSMMTKNVYDKFNSVLIIFSYIHLALAIFLMVMTMMWL